MKLTTAQINKVKPANKAQKLFDGGGLFLLVSPTGVKSWRLKYRFGGKERLLTIGTYPAITLKEARATREDAKREIAQGIDPAAKKQAEKHALEYSSVNTFRAVAEEFVDIKMQGMSKVHLDRTQRAINRDLIPALGKKDINEITAPELLMVLRKVESRGAVETAHRIKQVAGQIFRFGIATGRVERDITADLKGALRSPQKSHFPAITEPLQVGKLMLAIRGYRGTESVETALKLSPLLFCRPGELRHLEWTEVNWQEVRIEIPAHKMKIKEPLVIPLSSQALKLLEEMFLISGEGQYIFPSPRSKKRPLSDNAVRMALRSLGYENEDMTPHGFRAMARTLLDEKLGYDVLIIEQQLGHAVRDHNGRAYNRTKHLDKRRDMMQAWADYLDGLADEFRKSAL